MKMNNIIRVILIRKAGFETFIKFMVKNKTKVLKEQ